MLVLAIISTIGAVGLAFMVMFANGMRSSPGEFQGRSLIVTGFIISVILWAGWLTG